MSQNFSSSAVFYRRMNHKHPVIIEGEGIYLYDEDGKQYLDGSGGALVANIGHGVKSVSIAMAEQASKAAYIHGTMFSCKNNENYAHELETICPLPDAKFYFLTSGSEAIETALKFARQVHIARGHSERHLTIARWQSYHGATFGALAVTGKPKMRNYFKPMFMDVPHIPPPYCYRCHFNLTHPKCGIRCGLALEDEILRFGEDNISAFVAEPISGATLGAVVPPAEYWPIIREICDKYGILLIIDEVMTGMGRCGRWFAHEHWGIQADIITIGKGTTGGYFPLSIMAVKGEHAKLIANTMGDFIHGGTYSHHAVGCAAGLATLEYLKTYNLIDVVKKRGEQLQNLLEDNFGNLDYVGDIRGLGLMWGLEFVKDKSDKTPFNPNLHLGQKIADKAMEIGLIIYPGSGCVDGFRGDHIMIGPPYIITDEQLGRLVELIKQSISLVLEAYI